MEEAVPETDVLYMTRIQRERFDTEEEYNKVDEHCLVIYAVNICPIAKPLRLAVRDYLMVLTTGAALADVTLPLNSLQLRNGH